MLQIVSGERSPERTARLAKLAGDDLEGFLVVLGITEQSLAMARYPDCHGRVFTVAQIMCGSHLGRGLCNAYVDDSDVMSEIQFAKLSHGLGRGCRLAAVARKEYRGAC